MTKAIGEFRILLIDDDEDECILIRDLLSDIKSSKYSVTWKSHFNDGLKEISTRQYDVCLLDYRLGEQTGLDLLVQAQYAGVTCPIILLTGQGDFEVDLQAMQIGAAEYLIKGELTPQLLERSIRYAIKHASDVQDLKEQKEQYRLLLEERKHMQAQILMQDRMASIGLLASSLAHEIGTPMGIIRSRSEMAAKKLADHPVKQDTEIIIRQIDKITGLVNSLLNLARSKPSDQVTIVNINQVINDVINLVSHELERKNIGLVLQMTHLLNARSEPGPLGQVLLNLLVNAIHAIEETRKSEIQRDHRISILADSINDKISLRIKDTGCGITDENLKEIFKPFFTTKEVGQGTGLGLATSYKLIHSWGGAITVSSQLGEWTEFVITLSKT